MPEGFQGEHTNVGGFAMLLGLVSSYTMGGFIHILLVLAIVVLVINLISGRRGTAL